MKIILSVSLIHARGKVLLVNAMLGNKNELNKAEERMLRVLMFWMLSLALISTQMKIRFSGDCH